MGHCLLADCEKPIVRCLWVSQWQDEKDRSGEKSLNDAPRSSL